MGLMGGWLKGHMRDPVRGTAYIVSLADPDPGTKNANCHLTCVVQADGVPATTVEYTCMITTSPWPSPGATIPVTIDRRDPTRIRIDWNEVKATPPDASTPGVVSSPATSSDGPALPADALAQANALVARMHGMGAASASPEGTSPTVVAISGGMFSGGQSSISFNGQTIDLGDMAHLRGEMLALVARHHGDPVALRQSISALMAQHGVQLPAVTAAFYGRGAPSIGAAAATPPAHDPAERLKELDALHAQGLVNDEEYAAQRQRIIEGV